MRLGSHGLLATPPLPYARSSPPHTGTDMRIKPNDAVGKSVGLVYNIKNQRERVEHMPRLPDEKDMLEFVRTTLCETRLHEPPDANRFFFRDRFYHTLRVVGWVKRLCQHEQCDERLTTIAAIFHDAGYDQRYRDEHPQMGERICRTYMYQHGFPPEDVATVCELVRRHSFKKRPAEGLSPELRVLMDADLLDELGVTIVIWDSMDEGAHITGGYYSVLERVRRAYDKLSRLLPTLKTETGHAEYERGLNVLSDAIARLEYELHTDYVAEFLRAETDSDEPALPLERGEGMREAL